MEHKNASTVKKDIHYLWTILAFYRQYVQIHNTLILTNKNVLIVTNHLKTVQHVITTMCLNKYNAIFVKTATL